jgi:hypothetical protein
MTRDKNHPVWDVYDLHRTVRLNIKYFSFKLTRLKKINFWMEFILALTASSAIVTFKLWKTDTGSLLWQILSATSALLAILKPLLNITEKIRKIEGITTSFRILDIDLKEIEISIRQRNNFDTDAAKQFSILFKRLKELTEKHIDGTENLKLKRKFQAEVIKELPASSFFIPNNKNNINETQNTQGV